MTSASKVALAAVILLVVGGLTYTHTIPTSLFEGVVFAVIGYYFGTGGLSTQIERAGGKWNPPAWLLAIDSHLGWGFGVPAFFAWVFHAFWLGAAAIFVIAALKEVFFDPRVEGNPFFWGGFFDLSEYVVGIALSYGLYLAVHAL